MNRRHNCTQRVSPLGILMFLLLSGTSLSCAVDVPLFNAERSFADLVQQTEFGPRVPGTDAHSRCADWLLEELATTADTVWQQPFMGKIPDVADSVPLRNLIGSFGSGQGKRILLGAHWDTRPFADRDPDPALRLQPFLGANDGASGVAVLLEVARQLAAVPPDVGVDIIFFDGEDLGSYGSRTGSWIQGSTYFAAHLPHDYAWVIVLDMIGDENLNLPKEGYSNRLAQELTDQVWDVAYRQGQTAFIPYVGDDIIDDHLPFLMRGIPAVDIIDLDYPHWHTTSDTPEHCSPASLGAVGQVVLEMVYSE